MYGPGNKKLVLVGLKTKQMTTAIFFLKACCKILRSKDKYNCCRAIIWKRVLTHNEEKLTISKVYNGFEHVKWLLLDQCDLNHLFFEMSEC